MIRRLRPGWIIFAAFVFATFIYAVLPMRQQSPTSTTTEQVISAYWDYLRCINLHQHPGNGAELVECRRDYDRAVNGH